MKKIRRFLIAVFVFSTIFIFNSAQAVNNSWYPFEVKVAGLAPKETGLAFAIASEPVSNDAEVEALTAVGDLMILNIFPCDDKGTIGAGVKPEVIMANGSNKTRLNLTMSRNKLAPGTYLMNIMAGGNTSRVLFKIK